MKVDIRGIALSRLRVFAMYIVVKLYGEKMPRSVELQPDNAIRRREYTFLAPGDIIEVDRLTAPGNKTIINLYDQETGKWIEDEQNDPTIETFDLAYVQSGWRCVVIKAGNTHEAMKPLPYYFMAEFPSIVMPLRGGFSQEIDFDGWIGVVHQIGNRVGQIGNVWTRGLDKSGPFSPRVEYSIPHILDQFVFRPERLHYPEMTPVDAFLAARHQNTGVSRRGLEVASSSPSEAFDREMSKDVDTAFTALETKGRLLAVGNARLYPTREMEIMDAAGQENRRNAFRYLGTRGVVQRNARSMLDRITGPNYRPPAEIRHLVP